MFGEKEKNVSWSVCAWLKPALGFCASPDATVQKSGIAKNVRARVDSILEGRNQCRGFIWVYYLTNVREQFEADLIQEKPDLFSVKWRWEQAKRTWDDSFIIDPRDRHAFRFDNLLKLLAAVQSHMGRDTPGGYICRLNVERDEFWQAVEAGRFLDTVIDAIPARVLLEHDYALRYKRDRSDLAPIEYHELSVSSHSLGK